MKQAYTPGLEVSARARVSRIRELPLPGKSLVSVGDTVSANSAVLSADLPGEIDIIRVADRMGFDPEDVSKALRIAAGDTIEKGQLLCEIRTFFGLFTSALHSPMSGEVEFITEANAHIGVRHPPIPLAVDAYIEGKVSAVDEGKSVTIETDAALIQGIFGVGGERHGNIFALDNAPDKTISGSDISKLDSQALNNSVLVGGAQFSREALDASRDKGVAAVITGSIDAKTLHDYVGFDIGVSITGDEDVPFTLIITEGFGQLPISMRIVELAKSLHGKTASVSGATQVRAGAMRPEIIVPITEKYPATDNASLSTSQTSTGLDIGSRVRLIRVPYFGKLGTVTALPSQPQQIPTGAHVRVLEAKLDSGEAVIVPRANIELVTL